MQHFCHTEATSGPWFQPGRSPLTDHMSNGGTPTGKRPSSNDDAHPPADERRRSSIETAIQFMVSQINQQGGPDQTLAIHHQLPNGDCGGCRSRPTRWPCAAAHIATEAQKQAQAFDSPRPTLIRGIRWRPGHALQRGIRPNTATD